MPAYEGLAKAAFEDVVAKTADYQVKVEDNGRLFTNRGATAAVNFTMPSSNALTNFPGWNVRVFAVAAYNVAVKATNSLVAFNNATANSVTLGTANEIIGGGFSVVWDGTSFLVMPLAEETQTLTVA